jgi:hypothetical protein
MATNKVTTGGAKLKLQNRVGNFIPSSVIEEGAVVFFNWLFSDGIDLLKNTVDSNNLTELERIQVKDLLSEHNIEVEIANYTLESTLIEAIGKDIQDYLSNPEVAFHAKESLVEGLDRILDRVVDRATFIGEG